MLKQLPESGVVKVNVGGKIFMTHVDTLLKCPYFSKPAEYGFSLLFIEDAIFLDRCPELFSHILNFLREDMIAGNINDFNINSMERLSLEAVYFQLNNLHEILEKQMAEYFSKKIRVVKKPTAYLKD